MTEKTRILQLIASSHGGGAAHVLDLSLGLDPEQFQVTVAMPEDGGNVLPGQFTEADIEFVAMAIRSGFAWRQVGRMRRLVRDGRFHLIHVHGARAALYGRLAVMGMKQRPRVVFSIHGFATPFYAPVKRTVYLLLERWLQRVTERTICVAQAEADLFLQHRLAPPEKVYVVHPGIDVQRFLQVQGKDDGRLRRDLQLPTGSRIILTVCRLHIPRDFDTLLDAFAQIVPRFPDLHLLIVGDGPQREQIIHQIEQTGLTAHVHLPGFRRDIPDLMGLADIFVLTSFGWEGYPLSTLEAQAAGVPVVVTAAGGSAEAVRHEQTGLVVPKQDATRMAAAFTRLLTDASLRQQMGTAGQARAKTQLTREVMVREITAVYQNLRRG
ncbi:MAG: glycosyltransferase family 4 protein, partial [Anaerolineae bacterium]